VHSKTAVISESFAKKTAGDILREMHEWAKQQTILQAQQSERESLERIRASAERQQKRSDRRDWRSRPANYARAVRPADDDEISSALASGFRPLTEVVAQTAPAPREATTEQFVESVKAYQRSLAARMEGREEYNEPIVSALIRATNRDMGSNSDAQITIRQYLASDMASKFCKRFPITVFDDSLAGGRMTKMEAIGILGFHPDKAGVDRLKTKYGLSVGTGLLKGVRDLAAQEGCFTKEQLTDIDFEICQSDCIDRGWWGVASFMEGTVRGIRQKRMEQVNSAIAGGAAAGIA
jgi:hypothetical protein